MKSMDSHGILQELRLVSPDDGALTWLGGLYYSDYKASNISAGLYIPPDGLSVAPLLLPPELLGSLIPGQGVALATQYFEPLNASERAAFGEASYKFDTRWSLTLGGRLYRSSIDGILKTGGLLSALSAPGGVSKGMSESGFSPKVALTYKPGRDVLFYGSLSRGFQFGGVNLPVTQSQDIPPTFKSSTIWSREIGVRSDWFDRTLRWDLTGFDLSWKNPQVLQDPGGVASTGAYIDNVGSARSRGLETTLRWLTPITGVSIEESASYIRAVTGEPFDDISGGTVAEGSAMPNSPTLQSATTLSYRASFYGWSSTTSVMNLYQTGSWNDINHDFRNPSRNTLNLFWNLSPGDIGFVPTLSVAVTNLLDSRRIASGITGSQSSLGSLTVPTYVYNRPRTIELRLTADFN
jgi:iron complex outermembrane receptor protein